ncbi:MULTISPECIES: LysR family transcriptional regulator [Rubrivivax]|uniref:LysR family transcriptional regulator n=1 Tax=Rubrivivax benzoatilyticus TaxID=316997 RepID=A0ABX0HZQ9_9BURK|nr:MULTISPECIES: LysR family transcriptional regulator [Rubrivivax]EGJ12161.1 transcriptional regulator, LysR family protein [Rubrivivax benzoatilyticus JA2 = ATCC BAA-35]MCC9596445.1 LysR family transcriptional regulator [Rubrivivax sp. JA1055]MCC9647211.1 LysR family transcriptional regulator [Rubrivivax sp. JA1029]NHK99304.1 LysR family transcriptional regulator [Rubrivivax benzoatilyticus]NHL25178.1 LysR family transcriptional regulator [Rubrivivax benzoatilyticus]
MNVAMVRLFLEVAEAGGISKVAARRQTVQSHISRQITEFEAVCGGPLFRRTGRGVVLTELGARAAVRLRAWLHETEQLAQDLRADAGQLLGQVRLGIIPSAAHPLLTRLHERLEVAQPGIQLDIAEAQGTELDAMLDSGAVDLAILIRFRKPAGGEEIPLCVAQTYLVSAPGDELTRQPTVPFSRLDGLPLVLPRRPSHWRSALDDAARGLGFQLRAVLEADSLTVQRELVARGSGRRLYSVLGPYSITNDLKIGRLQASRLVQPDLRRHLALALPRHGKLSPPCRVVAQTIQELVASWGGHITDEPLDDELLGAR